MTTEQPEIVYDDAPLGATEKGWHAIESYLRCPKEFQYNKLRGVTKPMTQTPDYFAVGTLMHVAKAHWFKNNFRTDPEWRSSLIKVVAIAASQNKLPVTLKAEQAALKYMEEYVDHYAPRPRPKVIEAEHLLGPVSIAEDNPLYAFRTARLDDVSVYPEAGDALCIGETKTTSGSVSDCIKQYEMHGQLMLQMLLWKAAPQGEAKYGPVLGVMLDVIQKGYGGKPCHFARALIPITDRQLEWFQANLLVSLKAAYKMTWDSDARRNVQACTRLSGRARVPCDYQALCQHGRSASTNYLLANGESLLTWRPSEGRQVGPWE